MPLGFYGGILEGAKWESALCVKMKNPIDRLLCFTTITCI